MRVELSIEKSVEENAQTYFEKAKKLRKKLEGAKKALEETKKKEEKNLKKKQESESRKTQLEFEKSIKKEWYEKFRWFWSSDGFLVIAGRDASSNEVVVKKHMENNDLVYHTEAPGSPFAIVKNPEKNPTLNMLLFFFMLFLFIFSYLLLIFLLY